MENQGFFKCPEVRMIYYLISLNIIRYLHQLGKFFIAESRDSELRTNYTSTGSGGICIQIDLLDDNLLRPSSIVLFVLKTAETEEEVYKAQVALMKIILIKEIFPAGNYIVILKNLTRHTPLKQIRLCQKTTHGLLTLSSQHNIKNAI